MITEVSANGQTISTITHDDLKEPIDIAIDADGNIYVADIGVGSVLVLEPSGKLMRNIGSPGTERGHFKDISSVTIAPNGDIIVADSRIQVFFFVKRFWLDNIYNIQFSKFRCSLPMASSFAKYFLREREKGVMEESCATTMDFSLQREQKEQSRNLTFR